MTTDITELAQLVSKAKASVFTLEYISQFEPADIDSDDVDLRFEVDGRDTGTNVSIVDECGQAARVIGALVEALEKAQQRIAELEDVEQKLCAANVTLDARAELAERQLESRTVKLPVGYTASSGHPFNEAERTVMIPGGGDWLNRFDVEHVLTAAGIKVEAN